MNFPLNDQNKKIDKYTRVSASQLKSMNFPKNEQNKKDFSEKYHTFCVPSFSMKMATFFMPFQGFFFMDPMSIGVQHVYGVLVSPNGRK